MRPVGSPKTIGSGRKKGTPNKATLEKRAKAALQIVQDSQKPIEERELAKDALMRIAQLAEGAAAVNRPTPQSDISEGITPNPDGDWGRFYEWIKLTAWCYKAAADFQSPKMLGVAVAPAPPPAHDISKPRKLNIFEGGRYSKTVTIGERGDAA
jgi:hypothetical protein